MPTRFRPYQPDQGMLLPPDLRDWLPEGHLAHHVSDLVDGLDLTAFYAPYEGDGRRKSPYEPVMMAKVLIYGYATGVFSSRGLARKLEEDVAFRVLAAGNFPSHRTICEFRRRHLSDFKALFVEVVGLGARDRRRELRQVVDRRDEGSSQRQQAQGDELRSDAGGGAASGGRDRRVAVAGAEDRRGGGRAFRGGVSGRRVARGVAPPGGSAGGDPGGQGAFGGQATGGRRGAGTRARFEAQPEGRAAPTSGSTGSRTRRRRTTSRIRKAGS